MINSSERGKITYIMKKRKLSKSIRAFIRKEKARIRRQVLDSNKRQELVSALNQQFHQS